MTRDESASLSTKMQGARYENDNLSTNRMGTKTIAKLTARMRAFRHVYTSGHVSKYNGNAMIIILT